MDPATAVAAEVTAPAAPPAAGAGTPAAAAPPADAIDALDHSLDRALDSAASGLWSLAARVTAAVPKDRDGLRGFEAAARGVVGTVQRHAVQVEEALLDVAMAGRDASGEGEGGPGEEGTEQDGEGVKEGKGEGSDGDEKDTEGGGGGGGAGDSEGAAVDASASAVMFAAAGDADLIGIGMVGSVPGAGGGGGDGERSLPEGYVREDLDVNKELARAAETLQAGVGTLQARAGDLQATAGKTVGGLLGSLSLWAAGASDGEDEQGDDRARDAPQSRFQMLVRDLEMNPDTYCQPAEDLDAFAEWGKNFDLDALEPECVDLLDRLPTVAELYERVVPRLIEENTFWMRYFYARHALNKREQERLALLQRAVGAAAGGGDDDGGGWDDDDWDDDEEDAPDVTDSVTASNMGATGAAVASETVEPASGEDAKSAPVGKPSAVSVLERAPGVAAAAGVVEPAPASTAASAEVPGSAAAKPLTDSVKQSLVTADDTPADSSSGVNGASGSGKGAASADPSSQATDDDRPSSESPRDVASVEAAGSIGEKSGDATASGVKPPTESADDGSDSDDWE